MKHLTILVWKEEQRARPLFLALLFGLCVFVAVTWVWETTTLRPDEQGMARWMCMLFVFLSAMLLAGPAFAGERREGSLAFLLGQPVGRCKVWAAACSLRLCAWCALSLGAWALWRAAPGRTPNENPMTVLEAMRWAPLAFACVLLVSAAARRTILAVVAGGILAAGLAFVLYTLFPLTRPEATGGTDLWQSLPIVTSGVVLALSLWVFRRVRSDIVRGWRSARLVGAAYGAFLAAMVATSAAGYVFRCTTLAPRDLLHRQVMPSRDGRWLAVSGYAHTYLYGGITSRAAIVDCETGQARMLTQLAASQIRWRPWSPSGRYLLYTADASWFTSLIGSLDPQPGHEGFGDTFWTADMGTGKTTRRPHHPDGPAHMLWDAHWLTDDQLLFSGRETLASPPGATPAKVDYSRTGSPPPPVYQRLDGEKTLAYIYDAATKEWAPHPVPDGSRVACVSEDSSLLLACQPIDARHGRSAAYVIAVRNPAKPPVRLGAKPDSAFLDDELRYSHFSSGAKWLVTRKWDADDRLVSITLHDVATGRPKRFMPPDNAPDQRWHAHVSNDDRHIVWCSRYAKRFGTVRIDVVSIETAARHAIRPPKDGWCLHTRGSHRPGPWLFLEGGFDTIYRVRLDGSDFERVFPEKRPVTAEDFR